MKYSTTDENHQPIGISDKIKELLHSSKALMAPMGSRETSLETVTEETDYDYLIYIPLASYNELHYQLWEEDFTVDAEDKYKDSKFISYRKDLTNLIVTSDPELFRLTNVATDICRAVQVTDKKLRLQIYDVIKYINKEFPPVSLEGSLYGCGVPSLDCSFTGNISKFFTGRYRSRSSAAAYEAQEA